MNRFLCILFVLVSACGVAPLPKSPYLVIDGRDGGDPAQRAPLYRIELPGEWRSVTSPLSVADTMLPLVECLYEAEGLTLRLTIHNFPYDDVVQRIPPQAQIARWKRQFDLLESSDIVPQAFAGFEGYHFFGEGRVKGDDTAMSAWALRLAPVHERSLSMASSKAEQMRSDVTIKVTGPRDLMLAHQEQIARMARSFELLDSLPSP